MVVTAANQFRSFSYVESFVVIRNGYLVAEQYYTPSDVYTYDDIASVTKSFISALVGIAMHEGYIDSLGRKLMYYFPQDTIGIQDRRVYDITIEDLLTMRSGFDWDENADYSLYFNTKTNWIQEGIDFPMASAPGDSFNYASLNAQLMSGIITRGSHMSTDDLGQQYLFGPLGISVLYWPTDPQGYYYGAGRMVLYPRDLARFGYLFLKGGNINGVQIIPQSWVSNSTQTHVFGLGTWGDFNNVGYGYFWWTAQWNSNNVFMAVGYGGQFIIVVPSENMVVVVTSDQNCTPEQANQRHLAILDVVSKDILSAVRN